MNTIAGVHELNQITNEVLNWNYEPKKGIAIYTKSERYAHIEINIALTDYHINKVVWSVREEFIPVEFHSEVEEVLAFFCNYILALKGYWQKQLIIEITNGSFNHDTARKSFALATILALVNCFNNKAFELRESDLKRIRISQEKGAEVLKHFRRNKIG
jgi:hypothetical protein